MLSLCFSPLSFFRIFFACILLTVAMPQSNAQQNGPSATSSSSSQSPEAQFNDLLGRYYDIQEEASRQNNNGIPLDKIIWNVDKNGNARYPTGQGITSDVWYLARLQGLKDQVNAAKLIVDSAKQRNRPGNFNPAFHLPRGFLTLAPLEAWLSEWEALLNDLESKATQIRLGDKATLLLLKSDEHTFEGFVTLFEDELTRLRDPLVVSPMILQKIRDLFYRVSRRFNDGTRGSQCIAESILCSKNYIESAARLGDLRAWTLISQVIESGLSRVSTLADDGLYQIAIFGVLAFNYSSDDLRKKGLDYLNRSLSNRLVPDYLKAKILKSENLYKFKPVSGEMTIDHTLKAGIDDKARIYEKLQQLYRELRELDTGIAASNQRLQDLRQEDEQLKSKCRDDWES